ncbi:2-oxoglutarate dehydrogenase complex dihydrolipoyllysine-residue succinyltransferase [Exiguobacterium sp. SL-10]|uniref:2-oxoglutarate dehydrogenase complex dihydrolipoyllysine-residue succinyltransferase n=1 Tax=Exiguobacterium sp. SL-10 TaxID=2510962 RepID=UPI00103870DC|nr:2-oxoglutarate dehydrogenase complex dihydrolipoyllysine-residue succinyltransferase [Exiguobacterium sp. SL-10]TCI28712.1 2-oxoglutarate dehydrogenase complex dihydrolipoyllysine-residue succinyltransferase [Exiguobacterium sp. SL-10]
MIEIKVPELAESITEGTVASWLKQPGDHVEKGEAIVELETDKVNIEVPADESGTLDEQLAAEGDTVQVGQVIARLSSGSGGGTAVATKTKTETATEAAPAPAETKVEEVGEAKKVERREEHVASPGKGPIATPAARKLAREKGIDLSAIQTNDPIGRINVHDVTNHESKPAPAQAQQQQAPKAPATAPQPAASGKEEERIKMTRRRQTIANRLVEVQQTAAMLTTFNEIDMSAVMALRKRRQEKFIKDNDVKLGFMSFFTKAAVAALKRMPYLNAEIQGNEIVLKKYYDIGIAVSAPDGLVVPVVREADRKNFGEIEKDILHLADKARNNKLGLSDLTGGTFTITNGGVFGSLLSTPILNGPQVAILGMHSIQLRPIAIDAETMENRPMMYVALSYDHRIVDGREAVTFLKHIKDMIEDPEQLLFEA